jgi:RHS repeat-associated protein
VGNRLSDLSSLPGISPQSGNFNADDELSTETFDNNGNTLTSGVRIFTYDSQNHMTSMTNGSTMVTMTYDAFGNRVAKTANSITTRYLVEDDVNPTGLPQVMDEIVGGAVQRTYAYGLQRIDEYQVVNGAWTPSFYGYDGEGTVRQLVNSIGQVTDTYDYDAFGNIVNKTGPAPSSYTPNNFLYRGEQYDPDLNLYYLRARYMNPLTGRFMSRDPKPGHIEFPRSLHKYLYTSADPVNRVDPRGTEDEVEEADEEALETSAEEEGEMSLARELNCIFNAMGDAFDAWSAIEAGDVLGAGGAAVSLGADFESCSGEAEGKGGGSGKGAGCPKCFVAGTPIHTQRGDVPVEKIEVGDEVVTRSSKTGKLEMEPVTALVPAHKAPLLEMRIEGERTPLRPSTGHSFWVKRGDAADGSWMEAGNMKVGDLLQTMQDNWRRVVAITPLPGQQTVYNFTVDKDHDYFVGQTGFLVHNEDCDLCKIKRHLGRPGLDDALNHPPNQGMLNRLAAGNNTQWDQNFAQHELYEAELMDGGMDAGPAHLMTLEWQGIPYEPGYERNLYHPDVINDYPEMFNPACQLEP